MKKYYCWKCQKVLPFFEENEWFEIEKLLNKRVKEIKNYRETNNSDLDTALYELKNETSIKLEKLSEISSQNYTSVYHHRLSEWGEECKKCGYLMRTKEATFCANCGEKT